MSDSAQRSASTGSAEAWPRPSLNGPALRRDSKNTLYGSPSLQGSPKMMMARPSLQGDNSRRTSLSGTSTVMPSYMSNTPAGSRRPSLSQQSSRQYTYQRQGSISYTQSLTTSRATGRIPLASPDNDYLGFCKGAWKLQNGDRKGAMEKCKEAQSWSRNASRSTTLAQHLQCSQNKCAFRSNYVSNEGDLIYDKVISHPGKGIKLRWVFLAKSHVPQKVVIRNQYAFKCLFCVFSGLGARAGVYVGTDYYLDHISKEHRGQAMNEVLLFKTNCLNDGIADDTDDFDINLWPLEAEQVEESPQQWLSDSLLGDPAHMPRLPPNDSLGANEPWIVEATVFANLDSATEGDAEPSPGRGAPDQPTAGGDIPQRKPSVQSDISTPATVIPADFPTPPQRGSPENSTIEQWQRNTEQARRPSGDEQSGQPPSIPARSNARLASIRESRYAPEFVEPSDQYPDMQYRGSPMGSFDMGPPGGQEDLAITNCLKTIISAFNDAQGVVEEIKRRQPMATRAQMFPMLEESILEAPDEIDREWQRGVTRFSEAFEMGDYIAIIALQQTTIGLHNKLVDALRVVALGKPSDFRQLTDIADSSRHHVISTLHELRKRLMQAPPTLMSGGLGIGHERTMSPEPYQQQTQRSASIPTQSAQQHISHMRPDLWKDPYFPDKNADGTIRNASTSTQGSKHSRAQSDVTADATRRPSVLNSFKWGRKTSNAKSPEPDADKLADSLKGGLTLHQRKIQEADGLSDVVELDSTPVAK